MQTVVAEDENPLPNLNVIYRRVIFILGNEYPQTPMGNENSF
jgi:hypothetical protein